MENKTVGEYLLEIIDESKIELNQKQLTSAVLQKKKMQDSLEARSKMQPTVSKALKTLMKAQKVSVTEAKTYVAYSSASERTLLRKKIIQTIEFTKDIVFPVSCTTLLVGVETNCVFEATELLKAYVGKERCFDILFFNGYLVVFLNKFEFQGEETDDPTEKDNHEKKEHEILSDIRWRLQSIVHESIKDHTKKQRLVRK